MQSPLQQKLVPAKAFHLFDLLRILFDGGYENFPVARRNIKITEFATGNASIGDIYIPVDDPGDQPVVMMYPAQFIPNRHQFCKRQMIKQVHALCDREKFHP